eukprot:SM000109S14155  [mRNA]  locus=s109:467580:470963:+ [translate_table: standard]
MPPAAGRAPGAPPPPACPFHRATAALRLTTGRLAPLLDNLGRCCPLRELPRSGSAAVLGLPLRPPLAPPPGSPEISAVTACTWKRLLAKAREHLRDFDTLTCQLERLMEPHAPSSPPLPCDEGEVPSTACASEEPWLLLGSHSPPLSPCSASTISTETTTTRLSCDGALQSVWLAGQCALSLEGTAAKIRPDICDTVSHTEYADEASGAKRRRCPMIHDKVEDLCIGPNAKKLKLPIKKMEIIVPESFDRKQVPDDGWSWRKYGKKPIKSSPHPRNYFRCSAEVYDDHPCPARKHVEISRHDSNVFLVTYRGRHSHNPPPSPIVVPLVAQAGGPPVDIGPQDHSAQVSAKRPSVDACKIDGAQGTLGPVPSSSDPLDAAPVGPLTSSPAQVKVNINEKVLSAIISPLTESQDQRPSVINKLAICSTNKIGFANLEKYANEKTGRHPAGLFKRSTNDHILSVKKKLGPATRSACWAAV